MSKPMSCSENTSQASTHNILLLFITNHFILNAIFVDSSKCVAGSSYVIVSFLSAILPVQIMADSQQLLGFM